MNHNLANGMVMCKGNGDTATLLFYLKGLEILLQGRRGQVNTIVIEHFKRFSFLESRPAKKQHVYHIIVIENSTEKVIFITERTPSFTSFLYTRK